MFLGIDWEPVLPFLTLTAIIITVWISIDGLGRQYRTKVRQNLNAAGRRAAIVIVVAGVVTFGISLLSGYVSAGKERKEAAEREERFRRQMAALTEATRRLERLQGDTTQSLATQENLFDKAEQNLALSAALQGQEHENTGKVLQSVFEESNRVAPERIAVMVISACPDVDGARLTLDPQTAAIAIVDRTGGKLVLASFQKAQSYDFATFYNFLGFGDLGPLAAFEKWRGAKATIQIRAWTGRRGKGFMTLGELAGPHPEEPPLPLACEMQTALSLNGRVVLRAKGKLVLTDDEYYFGEVANMPIENARLPKQRPY